jgi:hypothetical protein
MTTLAEQSVPPRARHLARWIDEHLRPCPPHAWACPVVMKVDPDHVAWTCCRCGAIALGDDLVVKPE